MSLIFGLKAFKGHLLLDYKSQNSLLFFFCPILLFLGLCIVFPFSCFFCFSPFKQSVSDNLSENCSPLQERIQPLNQQFHGWDPSTRTGHRPKNFETSSHHLQFRPIVWDDISTVFDFHPKTRTKLFHL